MASEKIYIGEYRILAKLGNGAFGDVYLAQRSMPTNRIVAIKLMRPDLFSNPEAVTRFIQEAQFLNILDHPHILPIVDVNVYEGLPYIVTDYAPNGSLRAQLQRQPSHLLPIEESIRILAQVGQAVQYAHQQNIIHRNLKPENILFNNNGDVLLVDFNIPTILIGIETKNKKPSTGSSLSYMAPEQLQNIISKESDQYALACIAYELFTGRMPFPNHDALIVMHLMGQIIPPKMFNPQLPTYIEHAILKAMSARPAKRYTDVSTFIKALSTPTPHPIAKTREEWLLEFSAIPVIYPGNKKKIIDACEQALQVDSSFADAYFYKGVALNDLKRYEEALVDFEHATQLDPFIGFAWLYKGDLLKHFGRAEEAQQAYKKAKELGYSEDEEPNSIGFTKSLFEKG